MSVLVCVCVDLLLHVRWCELRAKKKGNEETSPMSSFGLLQPEWPRNVCPTTAFIHIPTCQRQEQQQQPQTTSSVVVPGLRWLIALLVPQRIPSPSSLDGQLACHPLPLHSSSSCGHPIDPILLLSSERSAIITIRL